MRHVKYFMRSMRLNAYRLVQSGSRLQMFVFLSGWNEMDNGKSISPSTKC